MEHYIQARETNPRKQHQVIHCIIHRYIVTTLSATLLCMYTGTPVVYFGHYNFYSVHM